MRNAISFAKFIASSLLSVPLNTHKAGIKLILDNNRIIIYFHIYLQHIVMPWLKAQFSITVDLYEHRHLSYRPTNLTLKSMRQ